MKMKWIILFFCFIIQHSFSQTQPWFLLDREQKDSVIFNHFNEGHKYLGMGFGATLLGGGWSGGSIKLEPIFGYIIRDRQMVGTSVLVENASTNYEEDYMRSLQVCIGGHYRYYLPERRVLSPLFAQVSLYGGYFTGENNLDSIKETADCFVLNLTVGAGISFPINKFNLELGLSQNYQIINIKILKEFSAGGTLGYLTFSYCF
jgi:hypothetical protein